MESGSHLRAHSHARVGDHSHQGRAAAAVAEGTARVASNAYVPPLLHAPCADTTAHTRVHTQVYEDTSGLTVGDIVVRTGKVRTHTCGGAGGGWLWSRCALLCATAREDPLPSFPSSKGGLL